MKILRTLLIVSLACVPFALAAPARAQAPLQVAAPWVRATVAQQRATGAFMDLRATEDLRLLSAASPVAGVVELHRMEMVGDVMKMRQIDGLDLPAGASVALKPGGYHVMLLELKHQVKEGEHVPLTLVVEARDKRRFTIEVDAVARALNAARPVPH
jgi:copper(I)-binding protein